MAFYRYTMFMQLGSASPPAGFSESWENSKDSDQLARNEMDSLINARLFALSQSWSIVGGRIAKLSVGTGETGPIIKQSLVQATVCPSALVGKLGDTDTPWTSALIEMVKFGLVASNASTRPRFQQMRGIPDTWWDGAALAIPAADGASMQQFFNYIIHVARMGQVRLTDGVLSLQRYRSICIKRISSRRIGRPFGLLRGRQSRQVVEG